MDTLSRAERSKRMALVRSKDTNPESKVRSIVRALGWRSHQNDRRLRGSPDIVLPSAGKIVFVHGCFWHRHQSGRCNLARLPKTRLGFWRPKLEANRRRDIRNNSALRRAGWSVITVWECHLSEPKNVERRLNKFLGKARKSG